MTKHLDLDALYTLAVLSLGIFAAWTIGEVGRLRWIRQRRREVRRWSPR